MGRTPREKQEEKEALARADAKEDHRGGVRSGLADSDADAEEGADQLQRDSPSGGDARFVGGSGALVATPVAKSRGSSGEGLSEGAQGGTGNSDGQGLFDMGGFWAAVKGGRVAEVRCLLADGADIGPTWRKGCSPLHAAASNGHSEVVQLLLQHGAEVAAKNDHGMTPLYFAACHNHAEVMRILLHHGAEVDAKNTNGGSALHGASAHGHPEVVRLLLQHGAELASKNEDGWTPLHDAAIHKHANVIRVLLENGAEVSPKNNTGWTPLHLAISKGNDNTEVVGLLLDNGAVSGADVEEEETKDVLTPLHLAALLGHAALVALMLEHGAAPSDKNDIGATLLHNAVLATKRGWTPLHLAACKGHMAVILVDRQRRGGIGEGHLGNHSAPPGCVRRIFRRRSSAARQGRGLDSRGG